MRGTIPSKCKHLFRAIFSLIVLYPVLPVLIIVINISFDEQDRRRTLQILAVSAWALVDLAINLILLFVLTKALHTFSLKHYWRYDVAAAALNASVCIIDDKQHELMIEVTRYNVLFGSAALINIACLLGFIAGSLWSESVITDGTINSIIVSFLGFLVLFTKEMALLTAIFLSFKFSHVKYEKVLKCCDVWVKRGCHRIARQRNDRQCMRYNKNNAQMLKRPLLVDSQNEDARL